jgi:hypothetical protein
MSSIVPVLGQPRWWDVDSKGITKSAKVASVVILYSLPFPRYKDIEGLVVEVCAHVSSPSNNLHSHFLEELVYAGYYSG